MVARSNTASLVDVMTRYQIYLEGFKLYTGSQFHDTAKALRNDIRAVFSELEVDDLSLLSRRELSAFISKLQDVQDHRYDDFTQQTLLLLESFMNSDLDLNSEIMDATQEPTSMALAGIALLVSAKSRKTLWAKIKTAPIPAVGITTPLLLERFGAASALQVETLVRIAHANKTPVQEALRRVVGSSKLALREDIITKVERQAAAVLNTVIQHTSSIISAAVGAEYFDRYRWVSVLDNRTTEICLERNGQIWRYGDGPLPPAHINCRSKTVPVDGESVNVDMTYYEWLKGQPEIVQNDILGRDRGARLRAGSVTAKDVPKFYAQDMLTLEQFMGKLDLILAT